MSWQEALFWLCLVLFGFPFVIGIAVMLLTDLCGAMLRAWRWCRRLM